MNAYFDQMILSASPVELVRLLFQRAISRVREARVHLREGRIAERAAAIGSAYGVVGELLNSLDTQPEPVLAQRLTSLYCYVQQRLVEANLKQIDSPLADVLGVLTTLAEAWQEVPAVSMPSVGAWGAADLVRDGSTSFAITA